MLFQSTLALWFASELALGVFRRAKRRTSTVRDRGSAWLIFGIIGVSMVAAAALQRLAPSRVGMNAGDDSLHLAWALLLVGVAVRWHAILSLGRHSTMNVAILSEHRLVQTGLYGKVRHPSYTGMLLAFLGLGVAFGSWMSLATLMIPITVAFLYRIHVEEALLLETFGEEYAEYRRETKRLVPGIY